MRSTPSSASPPSPPPPSRSSPSRSSPTGPRSRSGHLIAGVVGLTTLGALFVAFLFTPLRGLFMTVATSSTLLVPDEAGAWLARVGMGPRALAASGVASNQVSRLFDDARAHLLQNGASLNAAEEAYAAAWSSVDGLERKVVSGTGTPQDAAALEAARTQLASAAAAQATARAALFSAAAASLSANQRSGLQALAGNRAQEVGVAYRVSNRTSAQWKRLRDDLAHARVAAQRGESPDPAALQRLATADAEPAVAAARNALATSLDAVALAWSTASNGG